MTSRGGPGLSKAKGPGFFLRENLTRLRSEDACWRQVFARADVVSEGAVMDGAWFGSTSIVLHLPEMPAEDLTLVRALAARCLHVRLRALRIARREAQSRAGASLLPSQCEIRFDDDSRGLRIDVDVQASLLTKRHARV
jgi:hypothetical protein